MALVYRSERSSVFETKNQSDIGPGQYLPLNYKKFSTSRVPFNSSSEKDSQKIKKSNEPGPGFYEKDKILENYFINIDKNTNKLRKSRPIYQSLEIQPISTIEPLGFLSKIKRFDENTSTEIPGPGFYEMKDNFNVKVKKKRIVVNRSIVHQPNRLVSIPSKNQCYGYDIENNILKIAEDPKKVFSYRGDKVDSVSPGEYNIQISWNKRGTEWSKNKSPKNILYKKEPEIDILNKKITKNNLIEQKESKSPFNKEKLIGQFKNMIESRKKVVKENQMKLIEDEYDKIRSKNEYPGPGYYNVNSELNQLSNQQQNQSFGSESKRFKELKEQHIGPGYYYRDDTNICRSPEKKIPFNSSEIRSSSIIQKIESPGPGEYNVSSIPLKKSFGRKLRYSESQDLSRFKDTLKNDLPGPGSYDLEKPKVIKNAKYSSSFKSPSRVKIQKDEEEVLPGAGQYNSDILSSISYNVEKKISRPSMVQAPFNSFITRFKYDNKDTNQVGPGQYHNERKLKIDQKLPPFNKGQSRFMKTKIEEEVGPGSYNQQLPFDWKKKSYNILYV